MNLQHGDVFCVATTGIIPAGIRLVTRVNSHDGRAEYNHAGIILEDGQTVEALWTVCVGDLERYNGKKILIARPRSDLHRTTITSKQKRITIYHLINEHLGQIYPAWRIPLFIIPPLARYVASKYFLVCSELVAKYLFHLDARHGQYVGTSPDTLADEWRYWRNFDIIYEGVL